MEEMAGWEVVGNWTVMYNEERLSFKLKINKEFIKQLTKIDLCYCICNI